MDFAQQQRNPTKHLVGISTVFLIHVLVVYALVTGLARKVVEVIKQPLETKIIEEVKPPPPPEVAPPPPPKMAAPPPPFIPPPEVQIQQPPVVNVISAVTNVKPDGPPPPIAPRTVDAPPAPPVTNVAVACPNVGQVKEQLNYPSRAARDGISSGSVAMQLVIGAGGEIKSVSVVKSTNRVFNTVATDGARLLKCNGQGHDVTVAWEVGFKLAD